MLSGHGGIGRRVRLRGVWLHRPSSSLGDRTTTMSSPQGLLFLFVSTRLELVQLGRPQAKRDASAEHLRTSSVADIANNQNAIALSRRQSA